MSLSPLYSHQTIDLHVRIATSLHQSFLWLRHVQAKITTSFGSHHVCSDSNPFPKERPVDGAAAGGFLPLLIDGLPPLTFVAHPQRVSLPNTRIHVRLLGPCFKTGRTKPKRRRPQRASVVPVRPERSR